MVRIDDYIQQPGQKELLIKDSASNGLHVAIPGEVISYDSTTRTATIQPVLRKKGSTQMPPILQDVPVFFWGKFVVPVHPGDECLVVLADGCIDSWFENSGVSTPISDRKHDLSDGFAFVGFRSKKNVIEGIDLEHAIEEIISGLDGKKDKQTAVTDPTASGTSLTFIKSISQNEQGVITPSKATVSTMGAATSSSAGTAGLVPAPAAGDQDKFLRGNAAWNTVSDMINLLSVGNTELKADDYLITQYVGGGDTTTTYHRRKASAVVNATLVKAALGTNATHNDTYLRKDGTWETPVNTKNTAGATDTSSKIYLIGATSQGANPQTYSHDTAYVGTDGCLYSNSTKVKTVQSAVNDPTSSGTTIDFISSISQNANGVITATKSAVRGATAEQSGVVTTGGQIFAGQKTFTSQIKIDLSSTTVTAGTAYAFLNGVMKNAAGTVTYNYDPIRLIGNDASDGHNAGVILGSRNGSTFVSSGESSNYMPSALNAYNNENLYLTSDGSVYIYTNCSNDASSYDGPITISGTTITASLSGNSSTATKLATARTIDGVSFDGSANITHFGTCSTAAATAAKTVACTGFTLATGAKICVEFSETNTAANPTLSVNSTTAKAIRYRGSAIGTSSLAANRVYTFVYDGTAYELVGDINTDTKNTAGSTDSSSKLFLIGATSQAANPQTYSHDTAYVGTDGCLYSNSTKVKTVQTAVSDPSASGTSVTFIKTISQDANGVITPAKATVSTMGAATSSADGTAGLVPKPSAGDHTKFLRGSAVWNTVSDMMNLLGVGNSDLTADDYIITQYAGGGTTTTTYHRRKASNVINATLVKAALGTNATHGDTYLRKDGTWATPVNTKNTAGSTDSSSKLFLIGATSQAANPQTYSHDTAYVGTDGCLYSNGTKVLTAHQDISGKKNTQTAVSDPSASGSGITYIATISQNTQGVITATKSTVRDASASQSGVVNTTSQTFAGIKTFYRVSTTEQNYACGISFSNKDSTTGVTESNAYIYMYNTHGAADYGSNLVIKSGGNVFIGGGESPASLYATMTTSQNENLYATADGFIFLEANANTIANRLGLCVNTDGSVTPCKAEGKNNNAQNLGASDNKWASVYATTFIGALTGHASSDLALSGGTMTGTLTLKDSGSVLVWKGNSNITCTPTANGQEYSFDLGSDYTGTYWHVWSGKNSKSILQCYNDDMAVKVPNGTLTAKAFSGPLTGNVTGNCSGSSGSCTGNSATASALTAISSSDQASSTATQRYVWFCYDNNSTGRPSYSSAFTFQSSTGTLTATKVKNAVWNDYAEMRKGEVVEGGYCVTETQKGMVRTSKRMQRGCRLTSDTYGSCMGETDEAKTPIAVAGRVLARPFPKRKPSKFKLGSPVCSAPGGTVDVMSRIETILHPECIIGIVSEIPDYEVWHGGSKETPVDIKVDGRIWVYVR